VLRRATEAEIDVIRNTSKTWGINELDWGIWERQWTNNRSAQLPPSDWRYFVVGFRGPNKDIHSIEAAAQIASCDLDVVFTVVNSAYGTGRIGGVVSAGRWSPPDMFEMFEGKWHAIDVNHDLATEIRSLSDSFTNEQDPVVSDVASRARSLLALKSLHRRSSFRVLGYFAALESLLTHKPEPKDPYDSVTRQITKKVALLNHRWTPPLDYAQFGNTAPDKIWKLLYEFRSRVAHGSKVDFAKGALKPLKDQHTATEFVKQAVKAALRAALAEPQLVADLREI
jgi:hypothetical protein